MSTFILIHGAWTGPWIWERVVPILERAGHPVLCPSLSTADEGSGSTVLDLETQVKHVVRLLEQQDIHAAVLVGHGYGGMVVSGAADLAAERVSHRIYLDAFVPRDGESVETLLEPAVANEMRSSSQQRGEIAVIPPPTPQCLGIDEEEDVHWMRPKLSPQPLESFTQGSRQPRGLAAAIPATFAHCNGPSMKIFDSCAARARAAGWRFQVLSTGHCAGVSAPNQVADLLLEIDSRGYYQGLR